MQVMNALGTVPGHNDVINVHELWQIVRGLKNKTTVGIDGIPSEVDKFSSDQLLTMMLTAADRLYAYCKAKEYPYARSDHTAAEMKIKSKDPTDVNNYTPIAIAPALYKVLEQVFAVATRQVSIGL